MRMSNRSNYAVLVTVGLMLAMGGGACGMTSTISPHLPDDMEPYVFSGIDTAGNVWASAQYDWDEPAIVRLSYDGEALAVGDPILIPDGGYLLGLCATDRVYVLVEALDSLKLNLLEYDPQAETWTTYSFPGSPVSCYADGETLMVVGKEWLEVHNGGDVTRVPGPEGVGLFRVAMNPAGEPVVLTSRNFMYDLFTLKEGAWVHAGAVDFKDNSRPIGLFVDSRGVAWVWTRQALHSVDLETGQEGPAKLINWVRSLGEDEATGSLYIAATEGVFMLKEDTLLDVWQPFISVSPYITVDIQNSRVFYWDSLSRQYRVRLLESATSDDP